MIVQELQPAIPSTCTGRLIKIPIVPINMIIVAKINESIHMYAVHVSVMHYLYIHIYVDTCTSRMPYSRFDLVQSPCIFWSKSEKVCLKSTFPFVNLTLVEFDFIKIILAHSSFNHIPSSTI
jgi:hypothetical protein